MMKAMESSKTGSKIINIPKPEPVEGEVRVKVTASAVDTSVEEVFNKTIIGRFLHSMNDPLVLGWHFSGVVDKVGVGGATKSSSTSSTEFEVGQPVWGHLQYSPDQKQGAFAEYITVPTSDLALKPENVPHDEAAASTTESLTALQAIRDVGGLKKEGNILILGAGGGVGIAAVMIARRLGAHVTAVCSTKDVYRVRDAGADNIIDRKKVDLFTDENALYDVVFDTPGAYSFGTCTKILREGGAYVSTVPKFSLLTGKFRTLFSSKSCGAVLVNSNKKDLELVGEWLSDGMQLPIDSRHKVSEIDTAFKRRMDRTNRGQIVIEVENGWGV